MVNPIKTDVILSTRSSTEDLRKLLLYDRPLTLAQEAKYLGMTLNKKLS